MTNVDFFHGTLSDRNLKKIIRENCFYTETNSNNL